MRDTANWTARLNELATAAHVPGATLGIWSGGQEIVVAHGVLNSATEVSVTPESLFQVGSITKIWTATMIMQLVDEGRLSLDTTVAQALPGVRLGAADVGDRVTVRHLLTHTSGVDGDIFTDTGRGDECVQRYVALLAETPLSRWGDRTIIGHDGDTIGQSVYLRIDPGGRGSRLPADQRRRVGGAVPGRVQRCVRDPGGRDHAGTAAPRSGVARPGLRQRGERDGRGVWRGGSPAACRSLRAHVAAVRRVGPRRQAGNGAEHDRKPGALVGSEPEDLLLYPAEPADSSGTRFVLRSHDDEPWTPVSFGQLGDGTLYRYMSGRVTPASAEPWRRLWPGPAR
jgi:Beta-lactamase